jgi:hypothetical protein
MNSVGGTSPRVGCCQRAKGLEAEHVAVDSGLRLIVQEQLVAADRRAQIDLERKAVAEAPVDFRIEEAHRLATILFGAVERGIGVGQKCDGVGTVIRVDGASDAQADGDELVPHLEWNGDGLQQATRQHLGGARLIGLGTHHHELVAANASDKVAIGGNLEPSRHGA